MKNQLKFLTAALLLAALASCVELTGQRIAFRYDAAKDELRILLCHDGIHESPPSRNDEGPKQLAEYVQNGDILFLDWPGSVRRQDIRAVADDASTRPALRDLCLAFASLVRTTSIGRYRDPDGRVGAAQLVVVSRAKDFIGKINAALSEAILQEPILSDSPWRATLRRMQDGARAGRTWLAIDGHSLRFTFPATPAEWARNKAAYVKAVLEGWQEAREGKGNDNRPAFFLQLLALSPLSIDESDDGVSIRLGAPQRPLPLRFAMRDVYNPKLESTVAAAVPSELDDALARHLVSAGGSKLAEGIEDLAGWGPLEDSARALLSRASSADPAAKGPAIAGLQRLAEAWNQAGSFPRAPERNESQERYLDAWREWYRAVVVSPSGD